MAEHTRLRLGACLSVQRDRCSWSDFCCMLVFPQKCMGRQSVLVIVWWFQFCVADCSDVPGFDPQRVPAMASRSSRCMGSKVVCEGSKSPRRGCLLRCNIHVARLAVCHPEQCSRGPGVRHLSHDNPREFRFRLSSKSPPRATVCCMRFAECRCATTRCARFDEGVAGGIDPA